MKQELKKIIEAYYAKIEGIYEDPDLYAGIYGIERDQAAKELKDFISFKDQAVLGDYRARWLIISQYAKVIEDVLQINERQLREIINLKAWENNDSRVLFEILLDRYDIGQLIDQYQFHTVISRDDILKIFAENLEELKDYGNKARAIKILATLIYAHEDGQDAIDTLQHHNINEIGILDKDYIYIVYRGKKIRLEFLKIADNDTIINIQKKTTRNSKIQYDEQNPTVVASKNNASRITVAGYSATAADSDLLYNERIFNLKKITLEEMKENYGTLDELIYNLIIMNQKGRGSYLISGSDMGVGKSTFLAATIEKVPNYWGIGILDTQDELQARRKYPWKNIITLIENPRRTIAEQFQTMLKMARDVLFVGEITKSEEISQLINCCLRLNAGVGGTIHLFSPFEAVASCRNLLMGTDMYDDSQKAEEDISRGIDLIFHLSKLEDGKIIIERVVEICYLEKNYDLPPETDGPMEERLSNLVNMAQIALSKYLYQKCYRYNEIIRFDRGHMCWLPVNLPSDNYFKKLQQFVSIEEIEAFKRSFRDKKAKGGC